MTDPIEQLLALRPTESRTVRGNRRVVEFEFTTDLGRWVLPGDVIRDRRTGDSFRFHSLETVYLTQGPCQGGPFVSVHAYDKKGARRGLFPRYVR